MQQAMMEIKILMIWLFEGLFGTTYTLREIPYITINQKNSQDEEHYEFKVVFPKVQTHEINKYMCYAKSLDELGESYVTRFLTEPNVKATPHHVDAGLCLDPLHKDTIWECQRGSACKGDAVDFSTLDNFSNKEKAYYALPKGFTYRINGAKQPHYLIIQVHLYEPVTEPTSPTNITITFKKQPTKYNYQKFMLVNSGVIPANQQTGYLSHVGCEWKRPKVEAFDYYVHTHHHGYFAEGFLIRNKTLTYLGGQMTQNRPKVLFKIPNGPIEILPGDILASRCLFLNNENKTVHLGEDTCIFQLSVGYELQHHEYFARPLACMSPAQEFTFCNHPATEFLC